MNAHESRLHQEALALSREHRSLEARLIEVRANVDRARLFLKLDRTSLFQYAVKDLGLAESVAYALIAVARKSREVPELLEAIRARTLSASKASRLVPALAPDNAAELIAFATQSTSREIDCEVARRNPRAGRPERARPLDGDSVESTVILKKATFEKLRRIQDLEAQRGASAAFAAAIDAAADEYLKRKDPLAPRRLRPVGVRKPRNGRRPLAASEKREVFHRDDAQCTHVDRHGIRCENRRWLHVHHIRPASQGGRNNPENLTILCSAHHELAHQRAMPIEGQITWLRAPQVPYESGRSSLTATLGGARCALGYRS